MSANDDLFDAEVSHAIHLERLKARQVREIEQLLEDADEKLTALIRRRLARFAEIGQTLSAAKRKELEEVLKAISEYRSRVFVEIDKILTQNLLALGKYEAEFQVALLERIIPIVIEIGTPNVSQINAAIKSRPFQGRVLREWARDIGRSDLERVRAAIRQGVIQGQAIDDITRAIRGTRKAKYQDGILAISKRNAESVVRTAVNHTATAARDETFRANADIIKALRFTATLDGRTTAVCRAEDGKEYPLDKGPRPPMHFNCRSTMVPVLDGIGILGDRPFVTDTRTRERREVDFRKQAKERAGDRWKQMTTKQRQAAIGDIRRKWQAEAIGTLKADTTYPEWLKRQPAKFQDEVLGKTKGKLFRAGAPLDKFVDKSGHEYTLAQLKQRDAELFERAGIE